MLKKGQKIKFNHKGVMKYGVIIAPAGAGKYLVKIGRGQGIFSIMQEKQFQKNPIWVPTVDRNTGKKEARRVPTFAESRGGPTEPDLYLSNPKKRLTMQDRGGIVIAPKVIEIVTSLKKYIVTSPAILWGLADGSIFIRGYKGPKPEGNLRYIVYEDTFKAAREKVSLDRPWRHDVKSVTMMHLTRQGLLITSRQAPLWGIS